MSLTSVPISHEREMVLSRGRSTPLAVFRHVDYTLVLGLLVMTALGIFLLKGAVHEIPSLRNAAEKQAVFLIVAISAMTAACLVPYQWLNRLALVVYLFNLGALVWLLFAGHTINGARRWVMLGPVNWQPAETMKIATVLLCAQWLALHPERLSRLSGVLIPGIIAGLPALLILAQPDLGTASIFFFLYLVMMMMAGAKWKHLAVVCGGAGLGMASAFPLLKPYQRERLLNFVNPERDPLGTGYNVIQSKITVGNGGIFGQGWGQGSQTIHQFLPERHTDFFFPGAVEQWGFVGGVILMLGFAFLLWRMFLVMDCARDRFGGCVIAGAIAIFACHVFLNIGMTLGILPCTGLPLPLMSYGGTFLVTTYILFGIVLNVGSRRFVLSGP